MSSKTTKGLKFQITSAESQEEAPLSDFQVMELASPQGRY